MSSAIFSSNSNGIHSLHSLSNTYSMPLQHSWKHILSIICMEGMHSCCLNYKYKRGRRRTLLRLIARMGKGKKPNVSLLLYAMIKIDNKAKIWVCRLKTPTTSHDKGHGFESSLPLTVYLKINASYSYSLMYLYMRFPSELDLKIATLQFLEILTFPLFFLIYLFFFLI